MALASSYQSREERFSDGENDPTFIYYFQIRVWTLTFCDHDVDHASIMSENCANISKLPLKNTFQENHLTN